MDGGMLSNFPVWLFDAEEPQWPTFGLKLLEKDPRTPLSGEALSPESPRSAVSSVVAYLRSLVDTMMEAHDRLYIKESDFRRTIAIDTLGVRTTEFDLSEARAASLYESGRAAAEKFLSEDEHRESTVTGAIPAQTAGG